MPRPAGSVLALVLAAALFVAVGGCGEEDAELLPGSTAREITSNLDTVQQLADEGDCAGAEGAAIQVGEQVEAVKGVDPRLKRALTDGADRLEEVVAGCEEELEATEPPPSEPELEEEPDADQLEKEEQREEKEQEKREKEEEEDENGDEGNEGKGGGPPPSVPPSEGEEDDNEGGGPPPAVEEEDPSSGGVGPANPAGEG
ncbi:MAG TPA: hypothetical protein VFY04_07750 [Solirubrobacterales bacterium]|nr:hypothetical protein [Solirubrobacterales bacterium]